VWALFGLPLRHFGIAYGRDATPCARSKKRFLAVAWQVPVNLPIHPMAVVRAAPWSIINAGALVVMVTTRMQLGLADEDGNSWLDRSKMNFASWIGSILNNRRLRERYLRMMGSANVIGTA
jgi:hypothetical protein